MILSFFFFFLTEKGLLLGPRRENSQFILRRTQIPGGFQRRGFLGFFCLFVLVLVICFWLHWVFVALHGLSLVAQSRGYSLLQCKGFSWWLLLLRDTGSRHEWWILSFLFNILGSIHRMYWVLTLFLGHLYWSVWIKKVRFDSY